MEMIDITVKILINIHQETFKQIFTFAYRDAIFRSKIKDQL